MSSLIVTEGPAAWDVDVWWGEDWLDSLPQLVDPVSGDPVDVTSITFELYARPSFDHTTRLLLLSSVTAAPNARIIKDSPGLGLISFFSPLATVESSLPLTSVWPWKQFLRATFTDPDLGTMHKHIWTGNLTVHPARLAATP